MHPTKEFDQGVADAGGATALAITMGESVQTITNWRARGVPANRCRAFEAATGVSVKTLRPNDWADYWPESEITSV